MGLVSREEGRVTYSVVKDAGMCPLAEKMMSMPPLFKYFLDGSRRVYKVADIQYDKKVLPIVSGQI